MGAGNNRKYNKKEVIKIITRYGFEVVKNSRGQIQGDGDHIVYKHKDFDCVKIVIPSSGSHKMLSENEMSNLTAMFSIAVKVLEIDTSKDFKDKEGISGKFRSSLKRPTESLFSDFVRRVLGLNDETDINKYIDQMRKKIAKEIQEKAKLKK